MQAQQTEPQLTEEQLEINYLRERVIELNDKLRLSNNVIANLPTELDVAGPSLKLYFENEDERHVAVMVAAKFDQTLKQFTYNCLMANVRGYLKNQQELVQQAIAEQQAADEAAQAETEAANADGSGVAGEATGEIAEPVDTTDITEAHPDGTADVDGGE